MLGVRSVLALVGLLLALAAVELVGRVFLLLRPSYDVLFLEPDRSVGWRLAPSFSFTWTGVSWYARDFSVPVTTNALGFRDLERSESRQPGVARIALLGDSFVEALQVDREQTAAALLEERLNAQTPGALPLPRAEVLNFGVSNYGLGQFLLVWETYARRFAPDYVVVPVGEHLLRRTASRFEVGAFPETKRRRLWVRPTFRLASGRLVREPARDFDAFVRTQRQLVATAFGATRARVRETSLLRHLAGEIGLVAPPPLFVPPPRGHDTRTPSDRDLLAVNLEVLRTLGDSVHESGGQLVVADLHGFFLGRLPRLNEELAALSAREGFVYLAAHRPLVAARRAGRPLRWPSDPHFDVEGNRLFADVLHGALAELIAARADAAPE